MKWLKACTSLSAIVQRSTTASEMVETRRNKSGEARVAKPADKCFQCNGMGHFKRDCPQRGAKKGSEGKVGSFLVTNIHQDVDHTAKTIDCAHNRLKKPRPSWLYLDSRAETSVFLNEGLVDGIHEGPLVTVRTVEGSKQIDRWAFFGPIKVLSHHGVSHRSLAEPRDTG
jgi:hypothetical protein